MLDPQEASSYHFGSASDLGTVQNQKQPLDYGTKTPYGQFQSNRQVYQPPLAPYSANAQFYSPETQNRSYDGLYPPTNSAAVEATNGSQSFYTPEMAPLARTASDASEHSSSTAEGLSEALGELKIDESGTGRQSFDLLAKASS